MLDGSVGIGLIGLHQVDTGQELVGGENTLVVDTGDVHEHRQAGAGADEHGLEALLLHQLVHGDGTADDGIGGDGNAQLLQAVHFFLNDGLGQTELGDAVHQNAASQMQSLKHGDVITLPGQVAGAGQAGGTGTHHSHTVTVGSRLLRSAGSMLTVPVGHEALQTADAHRLALDAADAVLLALALLGADTAADGGQSGGSGDDLISGLEIALGDLGNEIRDMYHHGAALHAGLVLAVQAALGLVQSLLLGVAQSDLVKVLVPDVGVLRGHGILLQRHIGHGYSASFLNRLQVSSYLWASKSLYIWFRLTARSQSTL